MRISNSHSYFAIRRLGQTQKAIGRALERLSSGTIEGSTDAATLSQGVRLTRDIRALSNSRSQIANAQAVLTSADSALASQLEIVLRMRELAVQAANGTLSETDRSALDQEFQELLGEVDRLSQTTRFGDLSLLAEDQSFEIQSGVGSNDRIALTLSGARASDLFRNQIYTGTFQLTQTVQYSDFTNPIQYGYATESADFDNDGDRDLIFGQYDAGNIGVLLNDGTGSFSRAATISTGLSRTNFDIEIGDLNNDGYQDFISANNDLTEAYTVFLGRGDGSFVAAATMTEPAYTFALGDVNEDGNLDMISRGASDSVLVRLGNGDGTFRSAQSIGTGGTYAANGETVLGDFDGDGDLDILTSNYNSNNMSLFLGNGDGSFVQSQTHTPATGSQPKGITVRDLNGDGRDDFIVSLISSSVSYFSNGNGTFTRAQTLAATANFNQRLADFNGDGIEDLALMTQSSGFSVLLGLGNGYFSDQAQSVSISNARSHLVAGDFDGDGFADVLAVNTSEQALVYLNQTVSDSVASTLGVSSVFDSTKALETLDLTIERILSQRSDLGAQLNRLSSTSSSLLLKKENLETARSERLDVDISAEIAELTRLQVLQQAQVAAFAQSNLQLRVILELLKPR